MPYAVSKSAFKRANARAIRYFGSTGDDTILIDSVPTAKLFFVVGTGIGTYEGEYDTLPDWKDNYTFALSLTEAIAAKQPNLVKPIRLKVGRYNQHMGLCLLAEIGTSADTLEAAFNTVPYLADAIESVCFNKAE